jgi:hypothetical protein
MAKGICPVCNKGKGVRPSTGKLYLHRVTKRGKTCIGSGKIPVEEGEITMVEIGEVTEVSKERLAIWDTVLERQRVQGFPAYSRKSHSKFGLLTSLGSKETGVARCIACGFMFQEWTTARSHECVHEESFRLHTGRKILTKKIRKSPKKAETTMRVMDTPTISIDPHVYAGELIRLDVENTELKVKLAGLEKEFKDISIELDAFYTSKDTPVSEGLISRLSKQWGSKPPGNESMFPQS